jgi:hypothetical protein
MDFKIAVQINFWRRFLLPMGLQMVNQFHKGAILDYYTVWAVTHFELEGLYDQSIYM